jgi:hypothetical protein
MEQGNRQSIKQTNKQTNKQANNNTNKKQITPDFIPMNKAIPPLLNFGTKQINILHKNISIRWHPFISNWEMNNFNTSFLDSNQLEKAIATGVPYLANRGISNSSSSCTERQQNTTLICSEIITCKSISRLRRQFPCILIKKKKKKRKKKLKRKY